MGRRRASSPVVSVAHPQDLPRVPIMLHHAVPVHPADMSRQRQRTRERSLAHEPVGGELLLRCTCDSLCVFKCLYTFLARVLIMIVLPVAPPRKRKSRCARRLDVSDEYLRQMQNIHHSETRMPPRMLKFTTAYVSNTTSPA